MYITPVSTIVKIIFVVQGISATMKDEVWPLE